MPLKYPDGRMVTERCGACKGSGFHLKSGSPLSFSKCWMCNGWRGKYDHRRIDPSTENKEARPAIGTFDGKP